MALRPSHLLGMSAVVSALVALGVALTLVLPRADDLAASGVDAEPRTFNTTYDCTNSFDRSASEVPVNADVEVTRTSADRVSLAVSTGKLDFDLGGQTPDVRLRTSMDFFVDGTPTTVNGSSTVTLDPTNPPDFPVADGTATATGTSVTLTPGTLAIDIGLAGFEVTLDCHPQGAALSVDVPVTH